MGAEVAGAVKKAYGSHPRKEKQRQLETPGKPGDTFKQVSKSWFKTDGLNGGATRSSEPTEKDNLVSLDTADTVLRTAPGSQHWPHEKGDISWAHATGQSIGVTVQCRTAVSFTF